MSPIQGFTRFRAWQVGKQSVFGTAVTATRRLPYGNVQSFVVNPNWTRPTIETGTLDPAIDPYRTTLDITGTMSGPVTFNDITYIVAGLIKGGVSPTTSGTAKTWTFQAVSSNADPWEYFTAEVGDDVTADQFQAIDGIVESATFTLPQDLGPWTVDANWRWGKLGTYPTTRANLNVDTTPTFAYGADTEVYINTTSGAIGTTKLTNIVRSATLNVTNVVDQKRYADGSNTRFQLAGYGRAGRTITLDLEMEKQAATFTEVSDWLATTAVDKWFELKVTSVTAASAGIPYSLSFRLPGNWFTRSDSNIGGNDTIIMHAEGFYDATGVGYPFRVNLVNTLSAL